MDKRETRRFEIGGNYTDAWYRMTASPSAEGITVLGTEITENKKIEEALREADQRKNEFLAVLSHELRNPLAPIRNSTYVLERAAPGSDQAKRALAVIDRQAAQLAHLVDDLLDVTRITRNKIQLQRQTPRSQRVRRATPWRITARSLTGLTCVSSSILPRSRCFVSADRNRLVQMMGNLLQNAAKFTGRGGQTRITISADATERRAVIQVADTGVGMDARDGRAPVPALHVRRMHPGPQQGRAWTRAGAGQRARRAARGRHHGPQARARPRAPSLSCAFRSPWTMPLRRDPRQPPARPAGACSSSRTTSTQPTACATCWPLASTWSRWPTAARRESRRRKNSGLTSCCATSAFPAWTATRSRAPSGQTRRSGRLLVALSGYALPEDMERASAAGFDRHLAKPPSLEKLEEILASR